MLSLTLLPGEYLTIGDDVVLQYDCTTGDRCRLGISAPREVPIVRGEVRERNGGSRPACVFEKPRWHKREVPWDRSKAQALAAMRKLLSEMDGRDEDVKTLRRQLDHMFPPMQSQSEDKISSPKGCPGPEPSEAGPARRGEAAK